MRAALLAAAVLAVLLFTTPWSTLWDRDEPRYAVAALEMTRSGQYLYPTLRGHAWLEKPILMYWLMSLSFRLFGPTELAARFWSPLACAAVCLLVFRIGRTLVSDRAGLWAMAVLSFNPLLMIEGTAATTDALLLAGVTAALAVFVAALVNGMTPLLTLGMSVSIAMALLSKGPLGLLVAILAMGGTYLAGGRSLPLSRRDFALIAAAALLGSLIFAAWFVPANRAVGGELLKVGLKREVLQRAIHPMQGHGGNLFRSLPYYLPVLLVGFSPWTLYLPAAISATAGGLVGGARGRALLAGWFIPNLLFFTAAATKLPHYILPVWPALALAVGGTLAAEREGRLGERERIWLRRGLWLFLPLIAAEVIFLIGVVWLLPFRYLRFPSAVLGIGLALLGVAVARHHAAGRFRQGAILLAVSVPCLEILGATLLLPAIERYKPVPAIAAAIARRAPHAGIWTYKFDAPSLDFYVQPASVTSLRDPRDFADWRRRKGPDVLVMPSHALDTLVPQQDRQDLVEVAAARWLDYNKGRWLDLVAVGHNLPGQSEP